MSYTKRFLEDVSNHIGNKGKITPRTIARAKEILSRKEVEGKKRV